MPNLDELIAEVRHRRAYSVYGEGTTHQDIGRLLDALVSVRAERDTALSEKAHWHEVATKAKDQRDAAMARIAELEMTVTSASFELHEQLERAEQAEARIAELKEAMKRMKVQRRSNGRRAQQAEARIAEAAEQLAEVLDQHDKDEDGATDYLDPTARRLQVAVRALNRVDRIVKALGLNEGGKG